MKFNDVKRHFKIVSITAWRVIKKFFMVLINNPEALFILIWAAIGLGCCIAMLVEYLELPLFFSSIWFAASAASLIVTGIVWLMTWREKCAESESK